jgi:hypothetical protein
VEVVQPFDVGGPQLLLLEQPPVQRRVVPKEGHCGDQLVALDLAEPAARGGLELRRPALVAAGLDRIEPVLLEDRLQASA